MAGLEGSTEWAFFLLYALAEWGWANTIVGVPETDGVVWVSLTEEWSEVRLEAEGDFRQVVPTLFKQATRLRHGLAAH